MRISRVAIARASLIAAFFVALEILCRLGIIDRVTMIPPSEMVLSLWRILAGGRFNADIAFTVLNTAAAIGIAVTGGFFIGALLQAVPRVRRTIEPLFSAYYAVPIFVFYPLLVVAFGI